MVDSHCHVAGPEFADDLTAVVDRALQAGVDSALVILEVTDVVELARAGVVGAVWPAARFAVGVHPHMAKAFDGRAGDVEAAVAAAASLPSVRAVGEMGLDYHYDFSPRHVQQEVFRAQIRLARRLQLPVVIHTREADEDTCAILEEEDARAVGGVFHCFTGDRQLARRALDLGFHLSLSGIVTFPKAAELKEVARFVPLDSLLIETDSPFLSPVPHRGARNEPARVGLVAETVAMLRGVAVERVREATTANFRRVFRP
jgi:TatD DNase family protein